MNVHELISSGEAVRVHTVPSRQWYAMRPNMRRELELRERVYGLRKAGEAKVYGGIGSSWSFEVHGITILVNP